jgi:hypothetical protein
VGLAPPLAAAIGSVDSRGNTLMKRCRRFGLLSLLVFLSATLGNVASAQEPAASSGLAAILDDCSRLSLANKGTRVRDKTASIGHMAISFADGTLVPVLGKSGTVLGAYFEGRGGYVYTTDDVADRDALASNVARVARSLRPMGGRLNDTFKDVLFLFGEPHFTELYAQNDTEATPSASMTAAFQKTLAGARLAYGELDFRTAYVRLNGRGSWLYTEFGGDLERVGYAYDDVLDGTERLFAFRQLIDYDVRFSETMSIQDLPGWNQDRRLSVVLTHADISVATSDNRSGTIDSQLTFHVRDAGTRLLSLGLLNNRDSETPDWRSPRNKLTVKRVLDASGGELPFAHKYREIVVEIPATTVAASNVLLRFETEGEVFVDLNRTHADNYFALEGDYWYPSPFGWAGQQLTFSLKARVKKPWRPVMSGREVSLRDDGPFVVAESRSDVPSVAIAVMAGKYFTHVETIDGLTVRVHAYTWNRKDVLEKLPRLVSTFVKIYGDLLGSIAFDELDIVEVPRFSRVVSPSGMILIGSETLSNMHDKYLSGTNDRLARGIAYQWFGHKAIPVALTDRWLAESFSAYFAGLAMDAIGSKKQGLYGFDEMLHDWRGNQKICVTEGTIATADYLPGWRRSRDAWCLLDSRGPLVVHMLRTSLGNDRFFAATKQFLDAAHSGPATTDDYARAVSELVKSDMNWFFDQWVRKGGNAQVDVEQHVDPAANGQFRVWGTIRQTPGEGFKKLFIPLVWDNAGKPEARVVFADQPEKKFEFLLPAKPGTIKPDPFQNNLATYK